MRTINIIILILFAVQLFGQEISHKKSTARLSLGLNYSLTDLNKSNLTTSNLSDTLLGINLKQGSGSQIGFGFIQKVNDNINLVTGATLLFYSGIIEYNLKGNEKVKASLDFAFIDIPFHIESSPFHSIPKLHIFSGPCFRINTGWNSNKTNDFIKLKNYGLSVDFGFGYSFNLKKYILPIDITFSIGATNFHKSYNDFFNYAIEELNFSNLSLNFSFYKKQ